MAGFIGGIVVSTFLDKGNEWGEMLTEFWACHESECRLVTTGGNGMRGVLFLAFLMVACGGGAGSSNLVAIPQTGQIAV
ncbi:MAG: hypothetical protein ACYTEG_17310, partial [Planctomycetota bacterium]